jgi:hypothetical protein
VKRKGLALLLGGGPHDEEDPMESEGGKDDSEDSAMELKAMNKFMSAGSAEEKLKAFKQLMQLCGEY